MKCQCYLINTTCLSDCMGVILWWDFHLDGTIWNYSVIHEPFIKLMLNQIIIVVLYSHMMWCYWNAWHNQLHGHKLLMQWYIYDLNIKKISDIIILKYIIITVHTNTIGLFYIYRYCHSAFQPLGHCNPNLVMLFLFTLL